jgi:hypothetical protein
MNVRKPVSAFRKVLVALVLLAVISFSLLLGLMASGGLGRHDSASPPSDFRGAGLSARGIAFSIVLAFLSVVALVVGVALYAIVLATRLFIFNFRRPVWVSFKNRWFVANILLPIPILFGLSGLIAAIGSPFLINLGMAPETTFALLFFAPFILLQLLTTWLRIWMPVKSRLARTRLRALGVVPARMDQGILLGISDPSRTSLAKGLIEDDIGMLWMTPGELVYEGDNDEFRVRPEQCLSIERIADAGSVSAYFGNVDIILTVACDGAPPRRVRLHPETSWTMTGTARASDRLANELEQWKAHR